MGNHFLPTIRSIPASQFSSWGYQTSLPPWIPLPQGALACPKGWISEFPGSGRFQQWGQRQPKSSRYRHLLQQKALLSPCTRESSGRLPSRSEQVWIVRLWCLPFCGKNDAVQVISHKLKWIWWKTRIENQWHVWPNITRLKDAPY